MNAPAPAARSGFGPDRPLAGIAFMLGGTACGSVMDAVAKHAVTLASTWQLVTLRSLTILILLAPMLMQGRGIERLRSRQPGAHLARGISAFLGIWWFLEALGHLPLATVMAIVFSTPLWITAFSVPLLGERVGVHRWAAVLVGFAGVATIMGPSAVSGVAATATGAFLALASAISFAFGMTLMRRLARTDTDTAILFYQNLVSLIGAGGVALSGWQPLPAQGWGMGILLGVLLIIVQFFVVRAFRYAPAGTVAPFQYTGLIWAALWGWLFWDEWPGANVWLGAALVVAAGLYVAWRERLRALENPPAG